MTVIMPHEIFQIKHTVLKSFSKKMKYNEIGKICQIKSHVNICMMLLLNLRVLYKIKATSWSHDQHINTRSSGVFILGSKPWWTIFSANLEKKLSEGHFKIDAQL